MELWRILLFVFLGGPAIIVSVLTILYMHFPTNNQLEHTKLFWVRRIGFHKLDFDGLASLARNPHLTPAELAFLGRRRDIDDTHLWVARNPKTPLKTLEAIGKGDRTKKFISPKIRQAVLLNPKVPEDVRVLWALEWDMV